MKKQSWSTGWCCLYGIWSRSSLASECFPGWTRSCLRRPRLSSSIREEAFTSYTTSQYKLHFYETQTGYRFILLSDPSTDSLRFVLRQIHVGPFVEHVVRNPLIQMNSRDQGIDNDLVGGILSLLCCVLTVSSERLWIDIYGDCRCLVHRCMHRGVRRCLRLHYLMTCCTRGRVIRRSASAVLMSVNLNGRD
jgi:hypothetical protein